MLKVQIFVLVFKPNILLNVDREFYIVIVVWLEGFESSPGDTFSVTKFSHIWLDLFIKVVHLSKYTISYEILKYSTIVWVKLILN